MAARGNRFVGVGRFGVACVATAVVALASMQPAFAQEAPPPATTTASEEPPAAAPPPAPEPTPPPTAAPEPEPQKPPTEGEAPPPADPPATDPPAAPTPESAPADSSATTGAPPAETPAPPKDVVKLEEAAPTPPPPAPSTPQPVSTPASAPPPTTISIVLQNEPATAPATAETANAELEARDNPEAEEEAAAIVSLRKPAESSVVALPSADDVASTATRPVRRAAVVDELPGRPARRQSCARPRARVPLSDRCEQIRDVAILRVTLTYAKSPAEVRAAIARVVRHVTIRRVEARPPPKSKAAKKRPVAEARPIVPFGASGQGMTNDGFNGSPGSASSSRLFAVPVATSVRVPRPARLARLRLPSTIPHGVNAAPPPARPG